MRCRRVIKDNNINNIVWFGSYGKNLNGTAKFYNTNNKHDNFSEEKEAVKDSLTQRLSILEGELWYDIYFGLPLLNKVRSKIELDSAIINIVMDHQNVKSIEEFESSFINNQYNAKLNILTNFGELLIII